MKDVVMMMMETSNVTVVSTDSSFGNTKHVVHIGNIMTEKKTDVLTVTSDVSPVIKVTDMTNVHLVNQV